MDKPDMTCEQMISRVKALDAMFVGATHWGSWMVMASNEREQLVQKLEFGFNVHIPNRHLARTIEGSKVS